MPEPPSPPPHLNSVYCLFSSMQIVCPLFAEHPGSRQATPRHRQAHQNTTGFQKTSDGSGRQDTLWHLCGRSCSSARQDYWCPTDRYHATQKCMLWEGIPGFGQCSVQSLGCLCHRPVYSSHGHICSGSTMCCTCLMQELYVTKPRFLPHICIAYI